MRVGGRRTALAACLAVLLAARVPAADAALDAAALALAALLAVATLATPWRPAERLRPAILPAAAALAVLPTPPGALLGFLPWPATAAATVLLLHHAFPAPSAPGQPEGPRRGLLRWALPLAFLALAAALPPLLPLVLPAPVAALHELRPIGAALATAAALSLLLLAASLLLHGLLRAPPADAEVAE